MKSWKNKRTKNLFKAMLLLKNEKECERFFRDLCTLSEINAMAERWEVVNQLNEGVPYRRIAQMTGASTATITRVAHWLHHGEGGYQLVLKR